MGTACFPGILGAPATDGLRLARESETERAPFGVPTDRPPRPGVDHGPAEPSDLLERSLHIGDGEIRQRGRVAWAGATFVDAEHGSPALGLPAAAFGLAALGELNAE